MGSASRGALGSGVIADRETARLTTAPASCAFLFLLSGLWVHVHPSPSLPFSPHCSSRFVTSFSIVWSSTPPPPFFYNENSLTSLPRYPLALTFSPGSPPNPDQSMSLR